MSPKYESVACNVCGADDHELVSKNGQFGLPLTLVLCKKCGLGYLNPRWDKEGYLDFYRYEYDKYYRPEIKKQGGTDTDVPNPILNRLKQFDLIPEQVNNILDIGSGEGTNLKAFGKAFPKARLFAIEPSQASQEHLRAMEVEVLGEDVDAPWEQGKSGQFDIVIMRHVLEHFHDPTHILQKIHGVLKESGILYIAVPNNLAPTRNLEKAWFRVVHTYYFNKYSLKNITANANLKIRKLVEGDEWNKGEVFLIAQKSAEKLTPEISPAHYLAQKNVFEQMMKRDNSLKSRTIFTLKGILEKMR